MVRNLGLVPRSLPPRLISTPPVEEEFPVPLPHIPVGGRLAHFLDQWEEITTDSWVLSILRGGLGLRFNSLPPLSITPVPFSVPTDPQRVLLLSEEVSTLLQKSAIEEVPLTSLDPGFYSRIFLVPKKTGGMRPVIDLSILNTYLVVPHFKMETNRSIRASLLQGMYTTSLDLTDAYFHCPIAPSYRKYLRFMWQDKVFQFKALPFGLSIAPLVFTKLFQAAIAHLHSQSIQIHAYLDDSLLKEFDPVVLLSHTRIVLDLFLRLGYLVSWKKSELVPSQDFIFLGEHFRTDLGLVFPPEEKFLSLVSLIQNYLDRTSVTVRQFSRLLGLINSLADVVPLGRLFLRPLQFYLLERWTPASQDWEALIPIEESLFPHLLWWTKRDNVLLGSSLSLPVPSLTLYSDASLLGWGAYLDGQTVSGMWSSQVREEHINLLEMRAALLAISHFKEQLSASPLVLATDNSTVVAYLKNQGGTHCHALFLLARDILLLCFQHQIRLVVRHIPGRLNLLADTLSRSLAPVNTEWELHQGVFDSLVLRWGSPNIDLFATSLNHKLPVFVSPVPDPKAFSVDAMTLSWEGMFAYAFPPFRFLAPVLHKISVEQCKIIVIAPAWPRQAWFPDLLRLSCALPLALPLRQDLLSQCKGSVVHQSPGNLNLHAWLLSGITSEREVFQSLLPDISPGLSESPLTSFTMLSGQASLIGVLNKKLIHSISLYTN